MTSETHALDLYSLIALLGAGAAGEIGLGSVRTISDATSCNQQFA